MLSLSERQKNYEFAYDYQIIKRLPIIIRVDGHSFSKLTRKVQKPYSQKFSAIMAGTMLSMAKSIDGCIFSYQQSDEISFIVRNDQTHETESWFANRIQKITSITAALATIEFNKILNSLEDKPSLIGDAIFDARVFGVPTISEAINNLVFRQQDCIRNAVTSSALVELSKVLGRKESFKALHEKSRLQRIALLDEKCNIDFHSFYPSSFRMGIAAYKVPKILDTEQGQVTRQKWTLDYNLPEFSNNRDFIMNILNSGKDIFRADRDLDTWAEKI